MRRMNRLFGAAALVFLASAFSFATVSVSGNLVNPATGSVSSRAFVRFYIRGCGGNAPRVTGTGIVLPSYTDFTPTAGAISGTLYDSLTEISCGGSVGATWYGVVAYYDGKPGPEVPYNVTGASFNLNNATPNTTSPVVAAPTGDSTYFRLDAGNIITGSPLPSGNGTQALGSTSARWDLFANDIDSNSYVKLRASSAPTCLSSIGFVWYDTAANAFKFCANAGSPDFLVGRTTTDTLTNKTLTSPTINTPTISTATFSATETGGTWTGGTYNGTGVNNSISLLNTQGPASPIVGTGADATMFTYSMPANVWAANKCITIDIGWAHTTGSASVSYKLKFGATTIHNPAFADTNIGSFAEYKVCNLAQNSQYFKVFALQGAATAIAFAAFGTSAVDFSQAQTISFTFSVAATDQVTPKFWKVSLDQ